MGWACAAAPKGIKWYIALLYAAVGWACAAVPYEIAWHVGVCFATRCRGWVSAAPNEIACYVALLYAPMFSARRAAPCWPAESLALLYIAVTLADIMSCCHGSCTASALNSLYLHLWCAHGQVNGVHARALTLLTLSISLGGAGHLSLLSRVQETLSDNGAVANTSPSPAALPSCRSPPAGSLAIRRDVPPLCCSQGVLATGQHIPPPSLSPHTQPPVVRQSYAWSWSTLCQARPKAKLCPLLNGWGGQEPFAVWAEAA